MPTGYTAAVKDGITFEQFAMNCARAFGALIMMRDSPSNAPIPERFEPSDYSAKAMAKARDQLATLEAMSDADATANAQDEHAKAVARHAERLAEIQALSDKYHAMLTKVAEWTPPTPEHQPMKEFMAQQLRESIQFDCSTKYLEAPLLQPGAAWRDAQIEKARKDVAYHAGQHAEEVERTEKRNAWLQDLRKSLDVKP